MSAKTLALDTCLAVVRGEVCVCVGRVGGGRHKECYPLCRKYIAKQQIKYRL